MLYREVREEVRDVLRKLVTAEDGVEIIEDSVCGDRIHLDRTQMGRREGDGVPEGQERPDYVRPPSRVEECDRQGQDALGPGLLRQHGGDKRERDKEVRA